MGALPEQIGKHSLLVKDVENTGTDILSPTPILLRRVPSLFSFYFIFFLEVIKVKCLFYSRERTFTT